MPTVVLTEGFVESVQPQAKLTKYIHGKLQLHVSPKGRHTWYEMRGSRRTKLGVGLTLKEARARCAMPNPDSTVDELFDRWCHVNSELRSLDELKAIYARHIQPDLGRMPLDKVQGAHVMAIRLRLNDRRGMANRVIQLIRSLWQHAIDMGDHRGNNVGRTVKKFRLQSRKRRLTDKELATWLAALTHPDIRSGTMLLFLLATGQRREEVRNLRAEEISADGRTWIIPADRYKTKEEKILPLSSLAVRCIEARLHQSDVWGISLSVLKTDLKRLRAITGLKNIWLHDFRKAFASLQLRAGVSISEIGASLGHRSEAVTQLYALLDEQKVLSNSELVATHIATLQTLGA